MDFDGTCVTHDYPDIGKPIGSERVLRRLHERGHSIILYTMRSGDKLQEAVDWYSANVGYELYGANVNKQQASWSDSPKVYAQAYIDDAALGCPLKEDPSISSRPFVDWEKVEELLVLQGLL